MPLSEVVRPAAGATGGCLCGNVRYLLQAPWTCAAVCHCTHCQRQSGSAFSVVVGIARDAFVLEGEVKHYRDQGDSGHPVDRAFCPSCGSPIFSMTRGAPDLIYVKAGTLDVTNDVAPSNELYRERSQRWVPHIIAGR